MARQQWQIRIVRAQRKDVDVALVVSAIVALGEQLAAESRQQVQDVPDAAGGDV